MANRNAYTDITGGLGESLAAVQLSETVGGNYKRPLFRPAFLGEKYPVLDFIVNVIAKDGSALGYFFVQVKSTNRVRPTGKRVPIRFPRAEFNVLAKIPAPTYVLAVDVKRKKVYLLGALKRVRADLPSISKKHDLEDENVRIALYNEVISFWRTNRLKRPQSTFVND